MCAIKVLVVDDDEITCFLLVASLEDQGCLAHSVNSGEEALCALDTNDYQVVITNLHMGRIDAHEVTRYIKQRTPDVKVVMITGASYHKKTEEAYSNGVDVYFEKPFDLDKLLAEVIPEMTSRECSGNQTPVPTSVLEM